MSSVAVSRGGGEVGRRRRAGEGREGGEGGGRGSGGGCSERARSLEGEKPKLVVVLVCK